MSLTDEDLAYMRETQAEHRPTAATLQNVTDAPDGMGGTNATEGEPEPIMVRVSPAESIPEAIASQYGAGVVTITMDLAIVTSGDKIVVSPLEAYQVVSDGAVGTWTTAQQVLAVRTTWPIGGA